MRFRPTIFIVHIFLPICSDTMRIWVWHNTYGYAKITLVHLVMTCKVGLPFLIHLVQIDNYIVAEASTITSCKIGRTQISRYRRS